MRMSSRLAATGIATALAFALVAAPAAAKCTRLGFSVNDYGKDGPTKDAQNLLDKYIADWAKSKNIAKYSTSKKSVNCELFLNLIVVDEHTCRAEATVCWGEGAEKEAEKSLAKSDDKPKKAVKKKAKADE